MASTGLLPASLLIPPSDSLDRRDWYDTIEERIARDVRTNLRRIVTEAFNTYLNTLTASGDETALDAIIEDWASYVATDLGPTLQGLYAGASISVWTSSPASASLPLSAFEGWGKVVNWEALTYQQNAINRLAQVGDNVWSAVNSKVLSALETGATNEELKAMIEQVTGFSEYRADTIARTETAAALNNGRYDAAVTLGEFGPVAKTWNAAVDGRSRTTHAELDGTTVAWNDDFVVGDEPMRAPHAPGASPENVVNCRCDLIELYAGDMDPDGRIWTANGPMEASEFERAEQAGILRENSQRMGRFDDSNPAPPPLLRPGDDGWEVYAAEQGLAP